MTRDKATEIIADPSFDSWLAGYLRGHQGSTVADAVAAWLEQDRLAALFAAQRGASEEA